MYMYQPWFQQGIFLSAGSTGMMLIIKQFLHVYWKKQTFLVGL